MDAFVFGGRNGTRVVNPGSVGNPAIRATAWWATVDGGDVELRTTDYDTVAAGAEMPRTDFADELLDDPYTVERVLQIVKSAA